MTPETLRALRASIKHWEENAAAETPEDASTSVNDCALCGLFINDTENCEGCPVSIARAPQCHGTPYWTAHSALIDWKLTPTPETEAAFRTAARAEVDFLKSLMPADAPKHLATDDTGDGR